MKKNNDPYFVRMKKVVFPVGVGYLGRYIWEILTYNGHCVTSSSSYKNKAQCRNVGKRFTETMGLEWRE